MKRLRLLILSALLAGAATVPWLVHRRGAIELRLNDQAFKEQALELAALRAENERLSNVVFEAKSEQPLSGAQFTELLMLRNEVGQLLRSGEFKMLHFLQGGRSQENFIQDLRLSVRLLHDRLQDAVTELGYGRVVDTALLADEMPIREGRVARMKRYMAEFPQDEIPELQFISEDTWLAWMNDPLVNERDYEVKAASLRGLGETEFASRASQALQQYAEANAGQFPTDLRQLTPYFYPPIDDAILERYEIVPADDLQRFFPELGGEWLITQRAPANNELDEREAIGLTSYGSTLTEGRWGKMGEMDPTVRKRR